MALTLAVVVLVALVATMGWTIVTRQQVPALALLVCSVGWPFVNGPLEGPVLWVLSPGHGLVLSDLLAPLGVLIATARLYFRRRRGRAGDPLPAPAAPVEESIQ